jgi:hypothetical protein
VGKGVQGVVLVESGLDRHHCGGDRLAEDDEVNRP